MSRDEFDLEYAGVDEKNISGLGIGVSEINPLTYVRESAQVFVSALTPVPVSLQYLQLGDNVAATDGHVVWINGNIAEDETVPVYDRAAIIKGILLDEIGHVNYTTMTPEECLKVYEGMDTKWNSASAFEAINNLVEDHHVVRRVTEKYPGWEGYHYDTATYVLGDPGNALADYAREVATFGVPGPQAVFTILVHGVKGDVPLGEPWQGVVDLIRSSTSLYEQLDRVRLSGRVVDQVCDILHAMEEALRNGQPPDGQPPGDGEVIPPWTPPDEDAGGDSKDGLSPIARKRDDEPEQGDEDGWQSPPEQGDDGGLPENGEGEGEPAEGDGAPASGESGEADGATGEDGATDGGASPGGDGAGGGRQRRDMDLSEDVKNAGVPKLEPIEKDTTREKPPDSTVEVVGSATIVHNPTQSHLGNNRGYTYDGDYGPGPMDGVMATTMRRRVVLAKKENDGWDHGYRVGSVHQRRAHKVALNQDFPLSRKEDFTSPRLDLVVLVDGSGSMCGTAINTANRICHIIRRAFEGQEGVGFTHLVYTGYGDSATIYVVSSPTEKLRVDPFSPTGQGSTPTAAALRGARTFLRNQEADKVLILITDGEPNGGNYGNTLVRQALKEMTDVETVQVVVGHMNGADVPNTVRIKNFAKDGVGEVIMILQGVMRRLEQRRGR